MEEFHKPTIREWAEEDRPREKLLHKGSNALSNAELIAILIGSGSSEESAVELSKHILHDCKNSIDSLSKLDIAALCQYKGIGQAKAISIIAAMELGKRRKQEMVRSVQITSSHQVVEFLQPIFCDLPHEEFWVIHLNRNNRIVDEQQVSKGGISGTQVDVRIILRKALQNRSSGMILCHNHPSGNRNPSEADRQITEKIKEAAQLFDINVFDHVIFTNDSYFSFVDEGVF